MISAQLAWDPSAETYSENSQNLDINTSIPTQYHQAGSISPSPPHFDPRSNGFLLDIAIAYVFRRIESYCGSYKIDDLSSIENISEISAAISCEEVIEDVQGPYYKEQKKEAEQKLALLLLDLKPLEAASQEVTPILSLLGFLSPDMIQISLLTSILGKNIDGSLNLLIQYSFVEKKNPETLSISKPFQSYLRESYEQIGHYLENYERIFYWMLPKLKCDIKSEKSISEVASLIPHATELASVITHAIELANSKKEVGHIKQNEYAQFLENIAFYELYVSNNYQNGKKLYKKSLDILQIYYNNDSTAFEDIINNLCVAYYRLGEYKQVINLLKQLLNKQKDEFGKYPAESIFPLFNIGHAYYSFRKPKKQEKCFTMINEILKNDPNRDQISKAFIYIHDYHWNHSNKSWSLSEMDTFCSEVQRFNLGKIISWTSFRLNIVMVDCNVKGYQNLEDYTSLVMTIFEDRVVKNPVEVGGGYHVFGRSARIFGNHSYEKEMLETAQSIFESADKKEERNYPIILRDLGNAYGSLGDYQKQIHFLTEALKFWRKYYPKDHIEFVITLNDLARVYGIVGKVEEQKKCAQKALKIFDMKKIPESLPEDVCENSGEKKTYFENQGTIKKILGLYSNSLDIRFYGIFSDICGALGMFREQKSLLNKIIDKKGRNHFTSAAIFEDLSDACINLGEFQEAKHYVMQALMIKMNYYNQYHLQIGNSLLKVARVSGALGQFQEQFDFSYGAIHILKRSLEDKDHLLIRIGRENLAQSLFGTIFLGKFNEYYGS